MWLGPYHFRAFALSPIATRRLQPFGADVAALIAESFVATVIRHRRELEAAGDATPRVLN
jgi:hypothetical protein